MPRTLRSLVPLTAAAVALAGCADPPTAGAPEWAKTPPALAVGQVTPPAPPSNLAVVSPRPGIVVLTWRDNSPDETRFEITRFGVKVRTVGVNVKTTTFLGLNPGVSYHWDVRACNSGGCSAYNGVVGKTPDGSDARTIDFTSIACATPEYHPPLTSPFTIDGYRFRNLSGLSFGSWCSSAAHYPGSAALFIGGGNTTVTLKKVGGGAYYLSSIDLAQLYYGQSGVVSIVFTGTRSNGTTVSETVSFTANGGQPSLQRFTFGSAFDKKIVSLSWSQGGNDLHQFDNVRVWP